MFKGTEKTRQQLSVVEELLTYWNIDEADDQLEELEDALICVDFGPKTAFKIADEIRDKILKGAATPTHRSVPFTEAACDCFETLKHRLGCMSCPAPHTNLQPAPQHIRPARQALVHLGPEAMPAQRTPSLFYLASETSCRSLQLPYKRC